MEIALRSCSCHHKKLQTAFRQRMVAPNDYVTSKHLFSPLADLMRFFDVVFSDRAFISDLISSESRHLLSWLKAQPCQTPSPLSTLSSPSEFFKLLHGLLIESLKICVGRDSRTSSTLFSSQTALPWSTLQSRAFSIAENLGEQSAHDSIHKQ